jgi:hypothetical protein
MKTEDMNTEVAAPEVVPAVPEATVATASPAKDEDTRMEGDFSPAEQEGRDHYKKLMEAMDNGEELPDEPAPDADTAEAAVVPPADTPAAPEANEEALSGEILALTTQATELATRLADAENKVIDLGDQLENGEINQAKYEIEKRRLMRDIESIEASQLMTSQVLEQKETALQDASVASDPWYIAANDFLNAPGNEVFNAAGEHHDGLKNAIQFAVGLKANENKTPAEIIAIASNAYRAMTGMSVPVVAAAPATPAKAPKPQPNIPPTLGMMQAALPNNDDAPYAHLSNLSGPAYEAAYSKLSQDQRDAYLSSLS